MPDIDLVSKTLDIFGVQTIEEVGTSRTTTYKGQRQDASGQLQTITVDVVERLTGSRTRFWIEAHDEHGRTATGNGHDDLRLALVGVHWTDLGKAPPVQS